MNMTLGERLALAAALPREGNFLTLRTAAKLREKLTPTDDEIETWNIIVADDRITWSPAAEAVDVDITNAETAAVIDLLRRMDREQCLSVEHMTLYEKFVEG